MSDDTRTTERDVQIHIHEHVAPLRERMGRIEVRQEAAEREIGLIRASLDGLRDRLDGMRDSLLTSIDAHQAVMHKRVDGLDEVQRVCAERLAALRWWVIGIGGGLGGAALLLQAIATLRRGISG